MDGHSANPLLWEVAMNERIKWIDASKGFMIIFMLWSHSWKIFCDLSEAYFAQFPVFFHEYTRGFVGITGVALYLLRGKLSAEQSLQKYCFRRGVKLIAVCLFIAIFFRVSFSHSLTLLKFDSVVASLVNFLIAGRSFGPERFVVRIAVFIIFAGVLIRKSGLGTLLACISAGSILLLARSHVYIPRSLETFDLSSYMLFDIYELFGITIAGIVGICIGVLIEHKYHWPRFISKSFPYVCMLSVPFLLSYQHVIAVPHLAGSIGDLLRIAFAICLGMLIAKRFPKTLSRIICTFGAYSLFVYVAHYELGFFVRQLLIKKNFLGINSFTDSLCASTCFVFLFLSMSAIIILRLKNKSLDTAMRKELGL